MVYMTTPPANFFNQAKTALAPYYHKNMPFLGCVVVTSIIASPILETLGNNCAANIGTAALACSAETLKAYHMAEGIAIFSGLVGFASLIAHAISPRGHTYQRASAAQPYQSLPIEEPAEGQPQEIALREVATE